MKFEQFKIFNKPHLIEIKKELEKDLNFDDVEKDFNQVCGDLEKLQNQIYQLVKEDLNSIAKLKLDDSTKVTMMLEKLKSTRLELLQNVNHIDDILFLNYLKGIVGKVDVLVFIVISIYKKSFLEDYSTEYIKYIKKLKDLAELFYKAEACLNLVNNLLSINSVTKNRNFIDIEYNLLNKFLGDYLDNEKKKKLLTKYVEERNSEIKALLAKSKKIEGQKNSLSDELQKLNFKNKELTFERDELLQINEKLSLNRDNLYLNYLFGDFLPIYDKIYGLLIEYKAIDIPFAAFCLVLQKVNTYNKIIEINTSNSVTIRLIGYLFHKMFKFSVSRDVLKENFDLPKAIKERFKVRTPKNEISEISKRYIFDIQKTNILTPNQIEVKDKIDDIFDL